MTTAHARGDHDWHSQEYVDHWIASDATRDAERRPLLRRLAALIPFEPDAAIRVLDVGAGYGALTEQVLARFAHATVVCHDFSPPMFAHARQRLVGARERVSFAAGDLREPTWTKALEGPFDAVVSAIAIHNVRGPERIRQIYREIGALVQPGGCFLNYELIFPTGPQVREASRRAALVAYQERVKAETGEEKSLAELAEELARRRARHRHQPGGDHGDHNALERAAEPTSLENQLRWLREAGFVESDCFWKDGQTAIIGGFKAGPRPA